MRRTVTISLGVRYDEAQRCITLSHYHFISSVNLDPKSERHHADLLRKLTNVLRSEGVPAPKLK